MWHLCYVHAHSVEARLLKSGVFAEGWRGVGSIIISNLSCFSVRGGGLCWFRAFYFRFFLKFYTKVSQGIWLCAWLCRHIFCVVRHCPSQKRQKGGICACCCTVNPRETLYIAWGLTLSLTFLTHSLSLSFSCLLSVISLLKSHCNRASKPYMLWECWVLKHLLISVIAPLWQVGEGRAIPLMGTAWTSSHKDWQRYYIARGVISG